MLDGCFWQEWGTTRKRTYVGCKNCVRDAEAAHTVHVGGTVGLMAPKFTTGRALHPADLPFYNFGLTLQDNYLNRRFTGWRIEGQPDVPESSQCLLTVVLPNHREAGTADKAAPFCPRAPPRKPLFRSNCRAFATIRRTDTDGTSSVCGVAPSSATGKLGPS